MTEKTVLLWVGLITILALFVSGCSGPSLTLAMAGMPNANPDATGRPSPVMIQMYELRADSIFKQAEMVPLFSDPTGVLGADLVAYDELTVLPATAYSIEYEPSPDTKFIGVMASFRQSAGKGPWKVIVPINPEKKSAVGIELNSSSLILVPPDKAKKWDPAQAVANYRETSRTTSVSSPVTPTEAAKNAGANQEILASPSRVYDYPPGPEAAEALNEAPEGVQGAKAIKRIETVVSQ
ncbi:MAG: type VI secretion system lipoprotein TssJ [Deltaproteobacteria bacterium]|nr:type VI secretion system lipoprotein TssJ [Deltaproteobacteria bacterium]